MILSKFQFQSKTQDEDVSNDILVLKTAAFKNDLYVNNYNNQIF